MPFTTDDDVTIVFFSKYFGTSVNLDEVRRQENRVEIRYKLVPHIDAQQTLNLALIPIGKLPRGTTSVDIVRLPLDQKSVDMGAKPTSAEWESRIVCDSFKVDVK
jgi:hypothetical protein